MGGGVICNFEKNKFRGVVRQKPEAGEKENLEIRSRAHPSGMWPERRFLKQGSC